MAAAAPGLRRLEEQVGRSAVNHLVRWSLASEIKSAAHVARMQLRESPTDDQDQVRLDRLTARLIDALNLPRAEEARLAIEDMSGSIASCKVAKWLYAAGAAVTAVGGGVFVNQFVEFVPKLVEAFAAVGPVAGEIAAISPFAFGAATLIAGFGYHLKTEGKRDGAELLRTTIQTETRHKLEDLEESMDVRGRQELGRAIGLAKDAGRPELIGPAQAELVVSTDRSDTSLAHQVSLSVDDAAFVSELGTQFLERDPRESLSLGVGNPAVRQQLINLGQDVSVGAGASGQAAQIHR